MTAPKVNLLPSAPSPYDNKKDFNTKSFAFTSALPYMVEQINQLAGYFDDTLDVNRIVNYEGTSFSLDGQHTGMYILTADPGTKELTVHPETNMAQRAGAKYLITNTGAGELTILEGLAVTITNNVAIAENETAMLNKIGADEWILIPIGASSGSGGGGGGSVAGIDGSNTYEWGVDGESTSGDITGVDGYADVIRGWCFFELKVTVGTGSSLSGEVTWLPPTTGGGFDRSFAFRGNSDCYVSVGSAGLVTLTASGSYSGQTLWFAGQYFVGELA